MLAFLLAGCQQEVISVREVGYSKSGLPYRQNYTSRERERQERLYNSRGLTREDEQADSGWDWPTWKWPTLKKIDWPDWDGKAPTAASARPAASTASSGDASKATDAAKPPAKKAAPPPARRPREASKPAEPEKPRKKEKPGKGGPAIGGAIDLP